MKRIDMLKLIVNQLDFLNGSFTGLKTEYTDKELANADVILTTVEQAGMKPPLSKNCPVLLTTQHVWEKENE